MLLSVLISMVPAIAQVPSTDLYVFKLTQDDTLRWHIHSPIFISAWNQGNYTNQPEWLDRHTLLVSAQRNGESQKDIYLLDLDGHVVRRLTATPENEFSPLLTPDRQNFSVVRQVHGDVVDQQIVQFPLDPKRRGHEILPGIKNVGYYCWMNADQLALYLVDNPAKLALATPSDGVPQIFSSGVGRCLRRNSSGDLIYVHKYSETFWFLKSLDPVTRTSQILIETLSGKEDFAISSGGSFFMASGSTLYVFDPVKSDQWMPLFDLAVFGLHDITRLAISDDNKIAIVDQK